MSQPRTTHPLTLREADRMLTAPGATFEMETALIRGQHLRLWKHAPPTLRDVFASTTRFAQREFVVYENERMTFAEHFEHANRLGHALLEEFGVRPGDRVALAMRNYPEAVVSFWAAAIVGAVVVPINAWWKGDELEYALKDCAARVLIADQERLARLEGRMPEIIRIAVRTHSAPDTVTLTDLLARYDGTQIPHLPNGYELAPDDPATLFYTSGTTGNPKGALGTHRNICT
ncbi:MAG: long-chain fatty acid--CoA ligase, partial [Gammaproteobacteria bacterium]|nr:long-chain fatty acid--CoA ligase [Gammaproteobacteria bacterium]